VSARKEEIEQKVSAKKAVGTPASSNVLIDLTERQTRVDNAHDIAMLQNCVQTKVASLNNDICMAQAHIESLGRSITQAAKVAKDFCPEHDENNSHWKRVFKLMERQEVAEMELSKLKAESHAAKNRVFSGIDDYIDIY
jgi:hypothetical protein